MCCTYPNQPSSYLHLRRTRRVGLVGNICCVNAGNPSSRPVSDANSASPLKRLTNPHLLGGSSVKQDVERDGAPCVAPGLPRYCIPHKAIRGTNKFTPPGWNQPVQNIPLQTKMRHKHKMLMLNNCSVNV